MHLGQARQIRLAEKRLGEVGQNHAPDVIDQLSVDFDAVDHHRLPAHRSRCALADNLELGWVELYPGSLGVLGRQGDDVRARIDDELGELSVDLG